MALLLVVAGFCGFKGLLPSQEAGHRGETVAAVGPSDNAVVVGGVRYRPIETYRVCDRVLGRNPELTDEDRALFGPEPDPATWKRLTLRAPKTDGSTAEVAMVRPPEWLAEHRPEVGKTVPIWVPECGIEGEAEVLSIGPCPPVKPGNGPVVLATFRHVVSSTVDLHVTGLDQPIGCTPNHPFWSQDRGQFVRADELKPGEHLSALGPDAYVESLALDPTPKPVYNLQVQGEHVYHVSPSGLLAHNARPCPIVLGETMADRVEPVARKLKAAVFNARSRNPARFMANQRRWILKQIRSGRKIYDIGLDKAKKVRSPYYAAEVAALRKAGFTRVFRRWVTGDNGRKFRLFEWVP